MDDGDRGIYRKCILKKSYKPVSRILSRAIIYLCWQLLVSINLPTLDRAHLSMDIERAVLNE